ncbi:MAG: sulfotransferase family 2 domain-containing protein [Pseudomonadota bacterium]
MLLSVHIPKTAGTSFRQALQAQLGEDRVALTYLGRVMCGNDYVCGFQGRSLEHLADEDAAALVDYCETNGVACIHGHYTLFALRELFPDARCITFLRDPLKRLISAYNHMFVTMPDRAEQLSFEDFVRMERTQNVYESHGVLEYIADFDFIGITEQYGRSLELLQNVYPELGVLRLEEANVSQTKRFTRQDVSDDFLDELRSLNDGDYEIYNQVCGWFEEECERRGL